DVAAVRGGGELHSCDDRAALARMPCEPRESDARLGRVKCRERGARRLLAHIVDEDDRQPRLAHPAHDLWDGAVVVAAWNDAARAKAHAGSNEIRPEAHGRSKLRYAKLSWWPPSFSASSSVRVSVISGRTGCWNLSCIRAARAAPIAR